MFISSFTIDFLFPYSEDFTSIFELSPISSSIVGGIFVGIGIGIMLRYETSTGGTDLIAQFLSEKVHINVGLLIFIFDALVIGVGGLLLSGNTFLLSALTISFVGVSTSLCTLKVQKL